MSYFLIKNTYKSSKHLGVTRSGHRTAHVVEAEDVDAAFLLAIKLGLGYPMQSTDIIGREIKKADEGTVERRKRGQGGKIWTAKDLGGTK
jgi:hypothetical protein